ncbi:MAG: CobW family GTP-binding protein [Mangrovibacterium sp.]
MDKRIPVTIITGFLGAGKTTLLNQLINENKEKKFAIIENEFGEIGIDGGLILGQEGNIFELTNGCICCSLSEGFYKTIQKLLAHPTQFNHLLVETTGIADPDSIAKAFLSSESIQSHFRIDGVITLADCSNLQDLLDEQVEIRKQIALGDVILLNKCDAIQKNYLVELEKLVSQINPMAAIHSTSFANIKEIDLLNLQAFSKDKIENTTRSFQNIKFAFPHQENKQKHNITSLSFVVPGSFDCEKFTFWLQNYLFFNAKKVFRVKGILSFADFPEKYIVQAVGDSVHYDSLENWNQETRFSKLVFIGKDLHADKIEDNLYQLLMP